MTINRLLIDRFILLITWVLSCHIYSQYADQQQSRRCARLCQPWLRVGSAGINTQEGWLITVLGLSGLLEKAKMVVLDTVAHCSRYCK